MTLRPAHDSCLLLVAVLAVLLASRAGAESVPKVRIGLDTGPSVVLGADSDWYVGIHRSGTRPARVPAERRWRITALEGARLELRDGDYAGLVADTIFAYPVAPDAGLRIGDRRFRGEALLWARDGQLFVVNVLDLESYLMGVVPLEIGAQSDARFEAIKAQAVAARSYTLANLGRWRGNGFDLKGNVQDQAYGGRDAEAERCTAAVDATRGVVATYDRRPIVAYYSSTGGGHTASASEVWDRGDQPYLRGVRDKTSRVKDSFCEQSPYYKWEEVWGIDEFERLLDQYLPSQVSTWSREKYGAFRDLAIRSRSESKRVSELELRFQRGSVVVRGDAIRWAVRRPDGGGLRSTLLERVGVQRSGARAAEVRIRGRGWGHGVGLCQYGAMGMSEVGYDYTQILRFYYRGTELRKYY